MRNERFFKKTATMQQVIYVLIFVTSLVVADRVVMTRNGPVKGITVYSRELEVEAFLAIPYAEPPVGQLRFRKPVPKTSWTGVYDASHQPPSCMQNVSNRYFEPSIDNMSEDCLFLNIWVPYSKNATQLKPIILFTHGGAFNQGSSNMRLYDGTNMARFGDVIVATLNYRVGAFGFFFASIEDADGNMGIYDQIVALKWIKNNAKSFGGDPENIVLMGESAGSMITGGHLSSPLTKNLFKRVIMQSGSPTIPLIFDNNKALLDKSRKVATVAGCADKTLTLKDDPNRVVQCLRRLPAQAIADAEGILKLNQMNPLTFIPRVGDAYLPKPVTHLLKEGIFMDTEMLLGINAAEGNFFLTYAAPDYFGKNGVNRTNSITKRLAYQLVRLIFRSGNVRIDKEIAEQYINPIQNGNADIFVEKISEAIGDYYINCNTFYQAEIHSLRNPVYFYVLTRRASSTPIAEWMKTTHFDELQYIFGNPLFQNFTSEEIEFSNRVMARWVAFAKTGNPNIPGAVEWPTFTREDPKYLEMNDEDSVHSRPDNYRCEFWRDLYQTVLDDDVISQIKKTRNLS